MPNRARSFMYWLDHLDHSITLILDKYLIQALLFPSQCIVVPFSTITFWISMYFFGIRKRRHAIPYRSALSGFRAEERWEYFAVCCLYNSLQMVISHSLLKNSSVWFMKQEAISLQHVQITHQTSSHLSRWAVSGSRNKEMF